MLCRVKPGQQLPHAGEVFDAGQEIDLPDHVAREVPHLVVEVLANGDVRPIGAPSAPALEEVLARHRPHERITILEEARAKVAQDLATLDRQIAAERAANAPPAASTVDVAPNTATSPPPTNLKKTAPAGPAAKE